MKILRYMMLVAMLASVLFMSPALSVSLVLTIGTSKEVYNAAQTLEIDGNITNNGVPVSDALVLLQVNTPKNGTWVLRTLGTGGTPVGPFPVEILNVTPCDLSGQPKYTFNRGEDAGFQVAIKNNAANPYAVAVTVNLYYSDGVPFKLTILFNGTLSGGQILSSFTWPITIPADAVAGQAMGYASIFDDFPNETGRAFAPEQSCAFNITSGGGGSLPPTSPPGTFNLTIPLISIPVWLGNYSVFATTYYGFSLASDSTTFKVILAGDYNHDGKIDMKDVAKVAKAFGTKPGDPLWNPDADITGIVPLVPDGQVDMRDVSLVAKEYGTVTIP